MNSSRNPLRIALLAAAGFSCAPSSYARQSDSVEIRSGRELQGRIVAETYEGIEVSTRSGASTKVPWEDVVSVDFNAPPEFDRADELAAAGRLEEALAALSTLERDRRLRRPVRQETLFRVADLHRRLGNVDRAIEAFQALLDEYPVGRYLDEAVRGIVVGNLTKGKADAAARALERIEKETRSAGVEARFRSRLDLLRGMVGEALHRHGEARAKYEAAERSEDLDADERLEATLGVGRILQLQGREDEAEVRFRKLVVADAPPLVLAGAWNGIADIARDEGVRDRDESKLTVALYGYLRGVVQYLPAEGEPTTEHRRSLAGAIQCFEYLAQIADDPKARRLNTRRAAALRERLTVR